MQDQTTRAIALRPTGNYHRAYFFMSLTTGRRLNRQSFNPLPLPQDVISGVHRLACRNQKGLDIWDRNRRPFLKPEDVINDDKDDPTYAPSDEYSNNNEYESDNNQLNHDNLNPLPDQEMTQQPAGVTIQNKNSGVHQNAITHSP